MKFDFSKKEKFTLFIFFILFLGLQTYISATNSFISDSLAKAFQIESIRSESKSIIYPAKKIDPENELHPITFIIQNQNTLKSVFSETFAYIYAKLFFFLPISKMIYANILFVLLGAMILKILGEVNIIISLLVFTTSVVLSQILDLSEVPITLCLVCLVYSIWTMAIQNRNSNFILLSIGSSVFLSFFRLELLIFSGLLKFWNFFKKK